MAFTAYLMVASLWLTGTDPAVITTNCTTQQKGEYVREICAEDRNSDGTIDYRRVLDSRQGQLMKEIVDEIQPDGLVRRVIQEVGGKRTEELYDPGNKLIFRYEKGEVEVNGTRGTQRSWDYDGNGFFEISCTKILNDAVVKRACVDWREPFQRNPPAPSPFQIDNQYHHD